MSNQQFNSLDDFQQFVSSTIAPWSREKRIALAAAMAERWLPVYESFSEEEGWGNPPAFQRAVQSVWDCVVGHKLSAKDHKRHKERIDENTPHLDDFDAEEVIATSAMIDYALDCCMSADNTADAVMAMVSGFEGVAPGIYTSADNLPEEIWQSPQLQDQLKNELRQLMDSAPPIDQHELDTLRQQFMSLPAVTSDGVGPLPPDVWESPEVQEQMENMLKLQSVMGEMMPTAQQHIAAARQELGPEAEREREQAAFDVWHLPQVQAELEKQLKLLKMIGNVTGIDRQQIDALREKLASPELAGSLSPRPEPSRGPTNEAIFEQYRREMNVAIKNAWQWENDMQALGDNSGAVISLYLGEWMSRYVRRKEAIELTQTLDVHAYHALIERSLAHDEAVQGDPEWDQETRFWIDMIYENRQFNGLEVDSPEKPHAYGPSLRRLWLERKRTGDSDQDLWNSILQWGRHLPAAFEAAPELGERLSRKLTFSTTSDVDHPWATEVDGEQWRVRLNDFPDDFMYTLLIDDVVIGSFNNWPESWAR